MNPINNVSNITFKGVYSIQQDFNDRCNNLYVARNLRDKLRSDGVKCDLGTGFNHPGTSIIYNGIKDENEKHLYGSSQKELLITDDINGNDYTDLSNKIKDDDKIFDDYVDKKIAYDKYIEDNLDKTHIKPLEFSTPVMREVLQVPKKLAEDGKKYVNKMLERAIPITKDEMDEVLNKSVVKAFNNLIKNKKLES